MTRLLPLLLLCGCSSLRIEAEHVSHLTAKGANEDTLWQANALLHWERAGFYGDAGLGWNIAGRHGQGFYGPPLTGTVRIGYEFGGGK